MSSPQSGNHNILAREAPSIATQTGTYSDGRPILTFAAAPDLTPPATRYNVLDFGARGDGVTDDTAALQSAITACQNAGGGIVFLPPGTYLISSTLIVNVDNVQIIGAGWGAQLLAAATFPAGPMLWYQGPGVANTFRYGCVIAEVFFNGNNVAGVGAIQLDSTYSALIEHCRIRYCIGNVIYLNGISGAFGAYTSIRDCHISDGRAGTAILSNNHEWSELHGGIIAWFDWPGGIGVNLNNYNWRIVGTAFDECDSTIVFTFANRSTVQGCQFDRAHTRFIYLRGGADNTISGNVFGEFAGTGAQDMIHVDSGGNARNLIANNTTWAGASAWTNFVNEASGVGGAGGAGNLYIGNDVQALGMVLRTGVARSNVGYNPRGASVTQLAVAATGVALTNTTGCDCMLLVGGGTITQIAIGGVNTGQTSGWLRIPAGQTITVTYSVAPTTFQWFGD